MIKAIRWVKTFDVSLLELVSHCMTCCLTVLPVPAKCDLIDCNTCLILDATRVDFITLLSLVYLSSHCMCLYLLLEPVTRSLACVTVYCIN